MSANQFEERLLLELKGYVNERSAEALDQQRGRRERPKRRSPWRLASGGLTLAAAVAVAAMLANGGSSSGSPASKAAPPVTAASPLVHIRNAAFAIDSEPSGAVYITILRGSEKPDVDAIRGDLAKAGVQAEVVTDVPSCRQLASSPGAPSPVGSAQVDAVTDALDRPLSVDGDLVYSVDASADTRGTTLWIMFSGTLSTIFVERTADSGPQPNCL